MRRLWLVLGVAIGLVAAGLSVADAQPVLDSSCVVHVPLSTTEPPDPASVTATESAVAPVPCPPATAPTEESTSIEPVLAAPPTTTESAAPAVTAETEAAETEVAVAEAPEAVVTETTEAVVTETTEAVVTETTEAPTTTEAALSPIDDLRAEAAASNLLDIVVPSFMTGPATVTPGTTWIGNMSMTVLGVGVTGWTSTVRLSDIRGVNTGRVLIPTSANYVAPSSVCTAGLAGSSPAANVPLSTQATQAKSGGALCLTSWPATVSIGIPAADVISDTYTATLTHSIF